MMSDEKSVPKEQMEEAIEKAVSIAVKEEIVDIHDDLFRTIWGGIMPTLGLVTTVTIIERAIYRDALATYLEIIARYPDSEERRVAKERPLRLTRAFLEENGKIHPAILVSQHLEGVF